MGRNPGFFVRQRENIGVGHWSWAVIPFVWRALKNLMALTGIWDRGEWKRKLGRSRKVLDLSGWQLILPLTWYCGHGNCDWIRLCSRNTLGLLIGQLVKNWRKKIFLGVIKWMRNGPCSDLLCSTFGFIVYLVCAISFQFHQKRKYVLRSYSLHK